MAARDSSRLEDGSLDSTTNEEKYEGGDAKSELGEKKRTVNVRGREKRSRPPRVAAHQFCKQKKSKQRPRSDRK